MIIRQATGHDAVELASLHVRAWRWAYKGLVPDAYLEDFGSAIGTQIQRWQTQLNEAQETTTWVAQEDETIVGFAITGPSRDSDAAPQTGEVFGIYLEPEKVGTGVGRSLFQFAIEDLWHRGYNPLTLWVLENNQRARRFYELAGWQPDGATKTEERQKVHLHEVRYAIRPAARHPGAGALRRARG